MLGIALLAALAVPKRAPALEGVPDSSGHVEIRVGGPAQRAIQHEAAIARSYPEVHQHPATAPASALSEGEISRIATFGAVLGQYDACDDSAVVQALNDTLNMEWSRAERETSQASA